MARKVEVKKTVKVEKEVKPVSKKIDINALRAVAFSRDLQAMKDAVQGIEGDNLTNTAVKGVLEAANTGIASQYIQQIIQRNI